MVVCPGVEVLMPCSSFFGIQRDRRFSPHPLSLHRELRHKRPWRLRQRGAPDCPA